MSNQDIKPFYGLKSEVTALVAPTKSIKVSDLKTCQDAVGAGLQVRDLIKKIEKTRKDLVGPLNDRVKEVNSYARDISEPLLASENYLKQEIVAFEVKQAEIRNAEIRRLEEERQAKLAELEKETEVDQEVANLFGTEAPAQEKVEQAQAIIEAEHREASWDINNARVKNTRKTWKCEATDLSKVPKEFLIVTLNEAAVLAAARAGVTEIAGVRIWQETGIAFGSKTYVPRSALIK